MGGFDRVEWPVYGSGTAVAVSVVEPATELATADEAANARYEAFMANSAAAGTKSTLRTLTAPIRAVGSVARRIGEAVGLATPRLPAPDSFYPRDAAGNRLETEILPQGTRDSSCAAFAVAAMMELTVCRRRDSAAGVPHVSVTSLFDGTMDVAVTAGRAKTGVVDMRSPSQAWPPVENDPFVWKLNWRWIDERGEAAVAAMKDAIVNEGPLVASVELHGDWDRFVTTDETTMYAPGPTAVLRGDAHALCIVGYDGPTRSWIVRNSVRSWGAAGYARLPMLHRLINVEGSVIAPVSVEYPSL
jgi:hypothetical protein